MPARTQGPFPAAPGRISGQEPLRCGKGKGGQAAAVLSLQHIHPAGQVQEDHAPGVYGRIGRSVIGPAPGERRPGGPGGLPRGDAPGRGRYVPGRRDGFSNRCTGRRRAWGWRAAGPCSSTWATKPASSSTRSGTQRASRSHLPGLSRPPIKSLPFTQFCVCLQT
jgi:hypothetical protein